MYSHKWREIFWRYQSRLWSGRRDGTRKCNHNFYPSLQQNLRPHKTDLPWYPSTTVTMSSNLKNDRPAQDISPIYASATPITMAVSSEPQQTEQSTWDPPFFPTVQEMNDWDDVKLHRWIDKRNPRLLQGSNLQKFQDAGIDGMGLLSMTREEFKQCGLSVPASAILMHLANQVRNSKTIPFG